MFVYINLCKCIYCFAFWSACVLMQSLSVCVCTQSTQISTREHAAAALAAGFDLLKLRTDAKQKDWYQHLWKVIMRAHVWM